MSEKTKPHRPYLNADEAREYQAEIRRLNAERRHLKGIEAEPGQSKRLTVTEVARTLLERGHRSANGSVTLTLNAKGDTQIEVQVPTSEELPSIEAASEAARAVYDALRIAYPRDEV